MLNNSVRPLPRFFLFLLVLLPALAAASDEDTAPPQVEAKNGVILSAAFPSEVSEWKGDPINISLADASLRDILQIFSQIGEFDLELAEDVNGNVTVDYKEVPWDKALAGILTAYGLQIEVVAETVKISPNPSP